MRETRPSGSEGGGIEFNRFSLPLSLPICAAFTRATSATSAPGKITTPTRSRSNGYCATSRRKAAATPSLPRPTCHGRPRPCPSTGRMPVSRLVGASRAGPGPNAVRTSFGRKSPRRRRCHQGKPLKARADRDQRLPQLRGCADGGSDSDLALLGWRGPRGSILRSDSDLTGSVLTSVAG